MLSINFGRNLISLGRGPFHAGRLIEFRSLAAGPKCCSKSVNIINLLFFIVFESREDLAAALVVDLDFIFLKPEIKKLNLCQKSHNHKPQTKFSTPIGRSINKYIYLKNKVFLDKFDGEA